MKEVRCVELELLAALRSLSEDLERGRVDDLRDRSRCHALGPAHELLQLDPVRGRPVVELCLKDGASCRGIWEVDTDVAIEPPRPDRGGVEVLDRVRRRHDEELSLVAVRFERGEELIDGSPGLLIGGVVAPLGDGVELVEEEEAREILDRSVERLLDVA